MSSRARAAIVMLFVFAAGVVAGIGVERHHLSRDRREPPPSSTDDHAAAIAELRDVLELDDEQMASVHRILQERQRVVHEFWETLRPEIQKEMQEVHLEIAELLTPEQRTRYHDWLQERARTREPGTITVHER